MHIRPAQPSDAPAIADCIALAESEMVQFFTGKSDPADIRKELLPLVLGSKSNRYSLDNNLVAEVDGVPAGSIIFFPADRQPELDKPLLEYLRTRGIDLPELFFEGEPGTLYLSTMAVLPDYRGRGIATSLIPAAEAKGAELGFARTSLLVSAGKPKARGLYERLGYAVLREVRIADVRYSRMIKAIAL